MTSAFNDCFTDKDQYRDPTTVNVTEPGWLIDYISSTFLNGWINYVTPVKAFVVSRYAEDFGAVKAKLASWEESKPYHTKLCELGDDVALLGQDKRGRYWYFYFDNDTSDCSIGVLDIEAGGLTGDQIVKAFDEHVQGIADRCERAYGGTGEALEIPLSCIKGWVSFK